ncbi:MAG: class I SAM-dependent methyltransferase, partial [Clostridia bacterium]
IDTANGEKLEKWNDIILIRPDPQVIWKSDKRSNFWNDYHGRYFRSSKGGGSWDYKKQIPQKWIVKYKKLSFEITPTNFKHTGLFPEQAVNWDLFTSLIEKRKENCSQKEIKILNLFAYTGGATLACAAAGANVTHVDAAKGMVSWASENAKLSNINDDKIRWIVDDCEKFVAREIRRGNTYDAIIMDPPSYGRGPSGEIWKLEDCIFDLVNLCKDVLNENPLFFALNSYTTGLNPSTMEYITGLVLNKKYPDMGVLSSDEIGVRVEETGFTLPCGSTALWINKNEVDSAVL